jgi:tetraether lipid synthase
MTLNHKAEQSPGVSKDRPGSLYGITRSVCPTCIKPIDAQLVTRGKALIMRKWCEEHGWFESLISPDADQHLQQRRFNKPGTIPLHFEREFHGCPDSCGLCPEHQQHTCLGILEITEKCNLACPVCFADAKSKEKHLTVAQIADMMERLKRCEGDPEVIQISGGEPTCHPQFLDIVKMANDKGFKKTLINTNGIRLFEEPDFLDRVAELNPTIYLQFDGFEASTYKKLRGKDLSEMKLKTVDLLSEKGMRIVLVTTLVRGVNEHELGPLVDYALDMPQIRCLNIQPATFTGRFGLKSTPESTDPMDRITLYEVTQAIAKQSKYGLRQDDFFPVPCPDPSCSLVTYIHKSDGEVRPIPRLVNVEDYLDYIKNASVAEFSDKIKSSLEGLFSMSAVPGEETTDNFCSACNIEMDWGSIEKEITMISMMHFMDEYNFDLARSQKCCVHEVLPDDGGIVPFCNYNVLRRGR